MKIKFGYYCAAALTVALAAGCASDYQSLMGDLKKGMSKREMTRALGTPKSTSAIDETVYLNYYFKDSDYPNGGYAAFVRLKDGKMDAIGKLGHAAREKGK